MDKIARGFLALAFSLTCAVPVFAGIADSPLPVLSAGVNTLHLYSVPGVVNGGGLGTYFLCTSTSTGSQVVAIELFAAAGGGPLNSAASTEQTVAAGATVTFGTQTASALTINQDLGAPIITNGSARVLSTSKSLICTAFLSTVGTNPAQTGPYLTITAKTKQKGD